MISLPGVEEVVVVYSKRSVWIKGETLIITTRMGCRYPLNVGGPSFIGHGETSDQFV